MSVQRNHILSKLKKSNNSTIFIINLFINRFVSKGTLKEIRDLIVLFAYAKGDYNTPRTFLPSIAGWQMQISISFTESKINKFVNTQMSKNNVPVYLPYIVERRWSIKKLKQEILKMNGIDGDLHEQYTLWTLRKWFYRKKSEKYTFMCSPDVDDNMKMKRMFVTGGMGYFTITADKGCRTVSSKLKASEKYILSKDKPRHGQQAKLYGWSRKKHYTKGQLFKLWGGNDLTKDDLDIWSESQCLIFYPGWNPEDWWRLDHIRMTH